MQNHGRWNIFTPLTDDMGWHNLEKKSVQLSLFLKNRN